GCSTELHPVYALAIHLNDNPTDDMWAIFVRNWGNEGYCSQDQHFLDTNRIAFLIPRPSAAGVQVNTASTFLTNTQEAAGPFVSLVAGQGAIVEFQLPNPEKQARINGELHLRWTLSPGAVATVATPVLRTASVGGAPEPDEVEKRLGKLIKQLPPNARQ